MPNNKPTQSDEELRNIVAYGLHQSGLWPYPEFVDLFIAVFTDEGTKEQVDRADELIKGGLNKKRMAELYNRIAHLKKELEALNGKPEIR
jgi:hypothetical protein